MITVRVESYTAAVAANWSAIGTPLMCYEVEDGRIVVDLAVVDCESACAAAYAAGLAVEATGDQSGWDRVELGGFS